MKTSLLFKVPADKEAQVAQFLDENHIESEIIEQLVAKTDEPKGIINFLSSQAFRLLNMRRFEMTLRKRKIVVRKRLKSTYNSLFRFVDQFTFWG